MGCRVKIHLNSNVPQQCGNRNQCGRDLIVITQSTVELPSALQKERFTLLSRLCDASVP